MNDTAYMEFLERQFEQLPSSPPPASLNDRGAFAGDIERWMGASRSINPRSPLGSWLGVSKKDVINSAALLAGEVRFSLLALFLKRSFDLMAALVLSIFFAPLMAVIAIAVRVDSPGPAIFRQTRIGQQGTSFLLYKFRTMVADTERMNLAVLADGPRSDGSFFKSTRDPRVTAVGRFLRRTSLDDLPQLMNVLRGEMSLVGPRPALPSEVDQYDERARRRLMVKPGVTGLWQVSGGALLSWNRALELDMQYVERWGILSDLQIIGRTIRAVMSQRNRF